MRISSFYPSLFLLSLTSLALPSVAFAQPKEAGAGVINKPASEEEPPKTGFRMTNRVYFRSQPIGFSLFTDLGYRKQLSDSDSLLLKNTYIEGGAYIGVSPVYIWAGGYVEALPLALLQIRGEVQYQKFFGNLGFLFAPPNADRTDQDPSWDLTDVQNSQDNGLGISTQGLNAQLAITPRLKLGRVVALGETRLVHTRMDIDTVYQEPFYDMLVEPVDTSILVRPVLGYIAYQDPGNTYLLTGLRYEGVRVLGDTEVSRDGAGFLLLWGLPKAWIETGRPTLALVGSYIFNDPTDRQGKFIVSGKLEFRFGAN